MGTRARIYLYTRARHDDRQQNMRFLTWLVQPLLPLLLLLLPLVVATHAVTPSDVPLSNIPLSLSLAEDVLVHQLPPRLPPVTCPECGRFLNFKTFHGNQTEFDDYPWIALLEHKTASGNYSTVGCGGAIVSSRYVLTSAHCVKSKTLIGVRVGEYDVSTSPDCLPDGDANNSTTCIPEFRSYSINRTIVHDKFSQGHGYDVALLELTEDIEFGDYVQPICLPTKPAEPQKFQIAGWGNPTGGSRSNVKLMSYISLDNTTSCRKRYGDKRVFLSEDEFCAGGKKGEQVCIGNIGAPMMGVEKMANGSYRMTIFGVYTPISNSCKTPGLPGVFMDILVYKDWLLKNIKLCVEN